MLYRSAYKEKRKAPKYYFYIVALLAIIWNGFFMIKMRDSFNPTGGELDKKAINLVKNIRNEVWNKVFVIISRSADTMIAIMIILIIIGILYYKHKIIEAIFFGINMFGIAIISQVVKFLVGRARPKGEWLVDISEYTNIGSYSFPSGHTMLAMAGALMIIYFILDIYKKKIAAIFISILIFIYAILVGVSRVYVGVHYLSDIVGGAALSALWVFIVIFVYRKKYI